MPTTVISGKRVKLIDDYTTDSAKQLIVIARLTKQHPF